MSSGHVNPTCGRFSVMTKKSTKSAEAVRRYLRGEPVRDIAKALGVSRARVYQLMQQARESGDYSVHVQVLDARGVPLDDVGAYLRRALATAGLTTHKRGDVG